jgi:peptide-methionine (R)-S-oxide reductase
MVVLNRRRFISILIGGCFVGYKPLVAMEKLILSDEEWKMRLSEEEYYILRQHGTERPGFSVLNNEKRKGTYHCAGCELPLFSSDMKYDSGTGWPSFSEALPGAFKTKIDKSFGMERVEYHCAKCGAHHGHVFDDGPKESGKRFCNNGLCLIFKPE